MSILTHNIFDNVRTRVIVLSEGHMILKPPTSSQGGWLLPGGGIERDESLVECARREVFEETGIEAEIGRIVFLREWVVPKRLTRSVASFVEAMHGHQTASDLAYGYGLEVYLLAKARQRLPTLQAELPDDARPEWIPIVRVPTLPVYPKELKWLCRRVATNQLVAEIPSFVSDLESAWADSPLDPFSFQ